MLPRKPRSDHKDAVRERQRAWLAALCELEGIGPTPLGQAAGVSGTTLSRLSNDRGYTGTLLETTIERLKLHYGVVGPDEFASGRPLRGFGEEAAAYRAEPADPLAGIVKSLLAGRPNAFALAVRTAGLEPHGYRKGDIVIAEAGISPQSGDVVVAQNERARETLLRVYRQAGSLAFLEPLSGATDGEALLVDGVTVRVASTVTECLRRRERG